MRRAKEVIGDRSPAEEEFDNEVLRRLRAGADIRLAIASANATHPAEALTIDDTNAGDVAAHYEYLLEHERIMAMMGAARSSKPAVSRASDKSPAVAGDGLAVLRRIDGGDLDKAALIAACEKLDGIGKGKAEAALKRLKRDGLVFGETRGGKTHYALTVKGKEISRRG